MGKYYVLKLNCARSSTLHNNDNSFDMMGHLSFYPSPKYKKDSSKFFAFNKGASFDGYDEPGYVMAEKKGDHFEEIITGSKILYKTDSIQDIRKASLEELEKEYAKPNQISCFSYQETSLENVQKYVKRIRNDCGIYCKLLSEISDLRTKRILHEEIVKRIELQQGSAKEESENKQLIR